METQPMFDTKPLLRPAQAEQARNEIKTLEAKVNSPFITDKAEATKQLRRVRTAVENQLPVPPADAEEEGRMVRRSKELLNDILVGMPSQEEMRKAPAGAVDKHMKWEKRNKSKILEWKNIQLRLTHGTEPEAANLERHRPTGSSLNMDSAFISGKQFYLPRGDVGVTVTFSDEQIAAIRALDPETADKICFMSNDQRAEVKDIISAPGLGLSDVDKKRAAGGAATSDRLALKKRPYGKRSWTPEQREAFGAKMKASRAAKKAQAQ